MPMGSMWGSPESPWEIASLIRLLIVNNKVGGRTDKGACST